MKRQGKVLMAAAMLALAGLSCFSDPVSSLRKAPNRIELDRSAAFIKVGDSLTVVATVRDTAGDYLPALCPTATSCWGSADVTIATVRTDTTVVPGNAFTRAIIKGVGAAAKSTTVTVTVGSLTGTVKVTLQ